MFVYLFSRRFKILFGLYLYHFNMYIFYSLSQNYITGACFFVRGGVCFSCCLSAKFIFASPFAPMFYWPYFALNLCSVDRIEFGGARYDIKLNFSFALFLLSLFFGYFIPCFIVNSVDATTTTTQIHTHATLTLVNGPQSQPIVHPSCPPWFTLEQLSGLES